MITFKALLNIPPNFFSLENGYFRVLQIDPKFVATLKSQLPGTRITNMPSHMTLNYFNQKKNLE